MLTDFFRKIFLKQHNVGIGVDCRRSSLQRCCQDMYIHINNQMSLLDTAAYTIARVKTLPIHTESGKHMQAILSSDVALRL